VTYGRAGSSPAFGTKLRTAIVGGFFVSKYRSAMDINIKNRVKYVSFAVRAKKLPKWLQNFIKIQ
jgi:hypothetical protein